MVEIMAQCSKMGETIELNSAGLVFVFLLSFILYRLIDIYGCPCLELIALVLLSQISQMSSYVPYFSVETYSCNYGHDTVEEHIWASMP